SASFWTLTILRPFASASDPPSTVKSWPKTATVLPSIVPRPQTTPSPSGRLVSIPNRWLGRRAESSASLKGTAARSGGEGGGAGEFVGVLGGGGIAGSGDALTGGLLAALVLIVHRALIAGVGRVPTLGEVLDALGCGPWGIRHTSTITTRTPIIVHSHQKNLK